MPEGGANIVKTAVDGSFVGSKFNANYRSGLKQGANPNIPAPDGATPLHWAAYTDDVAMADRLLRAGANVNARNELRVTPLLLACTNGSVGMVDRLLRAG